MHTHINPHVCSYFPLSQQQQNTQHAAKTVKLNCARTRLRSWRSEHAPTDHFTFSLIIGWRSARGRTTGLCPVRCDADWAWSELTCGIKEGCRWPWLQVPSPSAWGAVLKALCLVLFFALMCSPLQYFLFRDTCPSTEEYVQAPVKTVRLKYLSGDVFTAHWSSRTRRKYTEEAGAAAVSLVSNLSLRHLFGTFLREGWTRWSVLWGTSALSLTLHLCGSREDKLFKNTYLWSSVFMLWFLWVPIFSCALC